MQLLFASSNPHKISEVRDVLGPLGIEVIGLDALDEVPPPEPDETGETFEDNARIKAIEYALATGRLCLADDSGLEVDALDGAPGVHSAYYAGKGGTRAERDAANNEKLLRAMKGVPPEKRAARFVCVMVLADPQGRVLHETRGTFEGVIADHPRGTNGFGYDPLLYLPAEARTSAELSPVEKNARSHRGIAGKHMADWLAGNLP
jgi:XTP/dITP diphosphohydrolase